MVGERTNAKWQNLKGQDCFTILDFTILDFAILDFTILDFTILDLNLQACNKNQS